MCHNSGIAKNPSKKIIKNKSKIKLLSDSDNSLKKSFIEEQEKDADKDKLKEMMPSSCFVLTSSIVNIEATETSPARINKVYTVYMTEAGSA